MQDREEGEQHAQYAGKPAAATREHPSEDSAERARVGFLATELSSVAPLLLVSLLVLVSLLSWDGAFDVRYWSPLTLLALALLLSLALAGTLAIPAGAVRVAVGAFWAFAAWTMLTAVWSESAAAAWEGGARAIFYAALLTLAVTVPAGRRGRVWIGMGLVAGVVAIGLLTELRMLAGDASTFLAGRLNDPVGYRNGTAALFSFAAWPLAGLAARRGSASGLRATAFAAMILMLGLAFLTQSRGMVLGLLAGGAVSLAIGPDRLRRAWLALAAAGVVALGSGPLLEAYHASGEGVGTSSSEDVGSVALALALLCAGSFLVSLFVFVFDNGLRSESLSRGLRGAASLALVAAVAVVAVVGIARIGDPVEYVGDKWDEFTSVQTASGTGTRLGSVSGPRNDIWGVALDQFGDAPVVGAGEGSYRFAYYRERETDRNLDTAHSLPLRLLAETGLVGGAVFALVLASLVIAITRRSRLAPPGQRTWIAGMAAAGTVVLAQSSVDWFWLIPALFGLAVLALGLASSGAPGEEGRDPARAARLLVAIPVGAAIVSVGLLFLSGLYVRKARSEADSSPAASLSAARTAESLNPVSVTPRYLEAGALETMGDLAAARRSLRDALELEPSNFVTLGLLGDLEFRGGRDAAARRYYRRALELNPGDIGLRKLSEEGGSR